MTIAAYAAAGFLGLTFLITVVRLGLKFTSTEARRGRTINKNKVGLGQRLLCLPGFSSSAGAVGAARLDFSSKRAPTAGRRGSPPNPFSLLPRSPAD